MQSQWFIQLRILPVKQPRNIKQVKNIRSHILGDFRLSHDGILTCMN